MWAGSLNRKIRVEEEEEEEEEEKTITYVNSFVLPQRFDDGVVLGSQLPSQRRHCGDNKLLLLLN